MPRSLLVVIVVEGVVVSGPLGFGVVGPVGGKRKFGTDKESITCAAEYDRDV